MIYEENKNKKDVMAGKAGWTMFMEWNGVKMYSNGKEIRDQYGNKKEY